MKYLLFILFTLCISACRKDKCTDAFVTLKGATACKDTSIVISGITYRSDNLPSQYAIEGNHICIQYYLYEDRKMCLCCGGTIVHIISVH